VSYPNPTLFVGHIGEFFPLLFLEAILATQTNKLDGLAHVIIRVFLFYFFIKKIKNPQNFSKISQFYTFKNTFLQKKSQNLGQKMTKFCPWIEI
jgi:hypothetical protein